MPRNQKTDKKGECGTEGINGLSSFAIVTGLCQLTMVEKRKEGMEQRGGREKEREGCVRKKRRGSDKRP